ncbi:MAG: hypothetical protein JW818_21725 [Pirellulales bacterium]|nr:hypothetical protein [Pirellulales bacterium]
MSGSLPCHLLLDSAAPGDWNMAVDEVLLDSVATEGRCWWRFYTWAQPMLSLGYFQNADDRACHPESESCRCVRRSSGGGAILHDVELTYSLIVAAESPLARQRAELYKTVHRVLVEVLSDLGVRATLCVDSGPIGPKGSPFLCFQRRAQGDVLYRGHKVAGSAQRRRSGAILQHGSLLLGRSRFAPQLAGIADLADTDWSADELGQRWLARLAERLRLEFLPQALSDKQRDQAARLVEVKYGNPSWTQHRGRRPA